MMAGINGSGMFSWRHLILCGLLHLTTILAFLPDPLMSPNVAPYWKRPEQMERKYHRVPAASAVRFRCTADGAPSPTLRWLKDGIELNSEKNNAFQINPKTWSITNYSVTGSDNGNYTCIAENKYGSLNHTYRLEVIEHSLHRPILQAGFPANQTVPVGSNVDLICKVFGDSPLHIQWLKHIEYVPDGMVVVKSLSSSSVEPTDTNLHLKNVSFEDAGKYTCMAANSVGHSHSSAWLTIIHLGPILEAGLPANQSVAVGSNVDFVCRVFSDSPTHFQWLKHINVNGTKAGPDCLQFVQPLRSSRGNRVDILHLENVSFDDAGKYTCLVSDDVGYTHHPAWLTIHGA